MRKTTKGALIVVASAVCWSFSGMLSKNFAWNAFSKAGARAVVAVFIYAAARRSFKVKLTRGTLTGAVGVTATSLLYMTALQFTTSANAIVLQYSMPVYVIILNYLLFRTKPSLKQIITVPVLLAGVILCCAGENAGAEKLPKAALGNIIGLISGLTYAFVFIASRMKDADSVDYTYLGNLLAVLFAASAFFDPAVKADAAHISDWLLAAAMGVSLGLGYLLLGIGLKYASPVSAAVLENLEPVLNPVWVFLIVGERPDTLGLIGCALVLVTVSVYSALPEDGING